MRGIHSYAPKRHRDREGFRWQVEVSENEAVLILWELVTPLVGDSFHSVLCRLSVEGEEAQLKPFWLSVPRSK